MIKRIVMAVARRITWAAAFFVPVNKQKIVFSSFYGMGYGDNPKYIAEALRKQNENYQMIWLVRDDREKHSLPEGIIPCRSGSVQAVFHLATAKVWVDNCRKYFRYKKKNQQYIQTWHGFALKRIEKDVADNLGARYVKSAKKDSDAIDLILSDSQFMTKIYRNTFWYDGKIVEWGSPRNDMLIDADIRAKNKKAIHDYFSIPQEHKIVLYAPTFRANGSLEPYHIDLERVKEACAKKFGAEFVAFVRLHPNVSEKSKDLDFDWSCNVDVTRYPDMQMLLSAADVVISDYSSLMFDFALSGQPCFQFATDILAYKNDRNFYFALDQLPFTVAETNDALIEAIGIFDKDMYQKKLDRFFDGVGMNQSGNASEICAEHIRKICFGQEEITV